MRVYVGERDPETGHGRVWVATELPRPEIGEVVEILGELNKLMEFRRDGSVGEEYERHRAATITRKDEIVAQLKAAEESPHPVELVHDPAQSWGEHFDWGDLTRGTADLARSILTCEIGETAMPVVSMAFVADVLSTLDRASFRLPASDVWEWIDANHQLVEREMFEHLPPPDTDSRARALSITDSQTPAEEAEPVDLTDASGSAVVRACEQAWRDIQRHHPDLPNVVIILGTGVERGRLVKLGHWWGGRWIADGQARGEVLLAGEALHLAPAQVFEVLLHEAAHGLNAARRIPDTSRGGRYHNRRFAQTASEVLLEAESMPPYGFAATKLTPAAEERYGVTIDRLGEAIRIARQIGSGVKVGVEAEGQLGGGRDRDTVERDAKRNEAVTALCECDRRLRMAPSVYEQGPVVCGVCGTVFRDGAERRAEREPDSEVIDRTFLERRRAAIEEQTATRRTQSETVSLLDAQRARLEAALATETETDAPAFRPLRERLDHIDRLLGSLDAPSLAAAVPTPTQVEGVRELAQVELAPEDAGQLARWYENFGTPDEQPMPSSGDGSLRSRAARALLKADGTLREPRVDFGDHQLHVGDRVVATRDVPALGLGAGVPGTVDTVNHQSRSIAVDFATWGRLELSMPQMLDAGIAHDYVAADVTPAAPVDLSDSIATEASRIEPGIGW